MQEYITESNHGLLDYLVVTSTEFWEGLPDDIRTQVKAALDESIVYANELANQKNLEDKQKIIESGRSQVIELTPEQRQQWVDAMKPVWAQFAGEIGQDLIDGSSSHTRPWRPYTFV